MTLGCRRERAEALETSEHLTDADVSKSVRGRLIPPNGSTGRKKSVLGRLIPQKRLEGGQEPLLPRSQIINIRLQDSRYREMAGSALPVLGAWFAYVRSCGFLVKTPGAFKRRIEASRNDDRPKAVLVVDRTSGAEVYRLVSWSPGVGFSMQLPTSVELRAIRLGQLRSRAAVYQRR